MNILVIDDEPLMMTFWWDALEDEGHTVTRARDTERAMMKYNMTDYDLIVVDRMMPPGPGFPGSSNILELNTGEKTVKDIRSRRHLATVPIIMLTHYFDDDSAQKLCAKYARLRIEPKTTLPEPFATLARKVAEEWPVAPDAIRIPDDEPPNIAPYFVTDTQTGEPVRVLFRHCALNETHFLQTGASEEPWRYQPNFDAWLRHEAFYSQILKLVREDDMDGKIVGLYSCSNTGNAPWWRLITFETAPWNKRDNANREVSGVGRVLVARFLREWLWRNDVLFEEVVLDSANFDEEGLKLHESHAVGPFLRYLGFTWREQAQAFHISKEDAIKVLEKATCHPRDPKRRLT